MIDCSILLFCFYASTLLFASNDNSLLFKHLHDVKVSSTSPTATPLLISSLSPTQASASSSSSQQIVNHSKLYAWKKKMRHISMRLDEDALQSYDHELLEEDLGIANQDVLHLVLAIHDLRRQVSNLTKEDCASINPWVLNRYRENLKKDCKILKDKIMREPHSDRMVKMLQSNINRIHVDLFDKGMARDLTVMDTQPNKETRIFYDHMYEIYADLNERSKDRVVIAQKINLLETFIPYCRDFPHDLNHHIKDLRLRSNTYQPVVDKKIDKKRVRDYFSGTERLAQDIVCQDNRDEKKYKQQRRFFTEEFKDIKFGKHKKEAEQSLSLVTNLLKNNNQKDEA